MSHRNEQLSGLIRSTVARFALQIPPKVASVVSVTDVNLSRDFTYADIFISAIKGVEEAMKVLHARRSEIRHELATSVSVHRIPILRFHKDEIGERAGRIDKILAGL